MDATTPIDSVYLGANLFLAPFMEVSEEYLVRIKFECFRVGSELLLEIKVKPMAITIKDLQLFNIQSAKLFWNWQWYAFLPYLFVVCQSCPSQTVRCGTVPSSLPLL